MSTPIIFVAPVLAQGSPKKLPSSKAPAPSPSGNFQLGQEIWMFSSVGLLLLLIGLGVYGKRKIDQLIKKTKFEEYKNRDIQKKLKLALDTIRQMETNPDLVHSREFNLDYLRMRMDEESFNFAVVNQIKIKVKQIISVALRPQHDSQSVVGIANASARQVDETFDVLYAMEGGNKSSQRVLFRIQIKLVKVPTQSTNTTTDEIIECIEKFLIPSHEDDHWQPTIQGRLASIDWDQKAKPTPLLVLCQLNEGVNVSFRTKPNKRATAQ